MKFGTPLAFYVLFVFCSGASLDKDECTTQLSSINAQTNFDGKKFSGVWFSQYVTTYVFGDNTWDSKIHVWFARDDGSVTDVLTGHQPQDDGCMRVISYLTHYETAVFQGSYMGDKMEYKVLYTDYKSAVLYYCFHVNDDGTCNHDKSQIEIVSREPDDLTSDTVADILAHVQKIDCTDFNDLESKMKGKCEIPVLTDLRQKSDAPPTDDNNIFDSEMPSGLWQTIAVAVREGEKPIAGSIRFIPGVEDKMFYLISSEQRGDTCTTTIQEKYQRISGNHFLQIETSNPVELWLRKTLQGNIILLECMEKTSGVCTKEIVMLLTQEKAHINFNILQNFKTGIDRRLHKNYTVFVDQKADFCAVPELTANILIMNDRVSHSERGNKDSIGNLCVLKDIPVQTKLQESQFTGLWYEISRTRTVWDKYESAVLYINRDETGNFHSRYTGSLNHKCVPAFAEQIKFQEDAVDTGDMEAKMDGPGDVYRWHPFKVIYNDGLYLMTYECVQKSDKDHCLKALVEIYGRQPTIDAYTKHRLHDLLPSLCTSSDRLQDTPNHEDCTDWVVPQTGDSALVTKKCDVFEIPVQQKVSLDKMTGTWYVAARKNSKADQIDFRRNGNVFELDIFEKENDHCSQVSTDFLIRNGQGKNGDLLLIHQTAKVKLYYTAKIIYTDYKVAILYQCLEEDIDGHCTPDGTRTLIINREKSMNPLQRLQLESQLKLPCGDLSNLESVTDHCERKRSCKIDDMPVHKNVDQQKLLGIWYDVFRPAVFKDSHSGAFKYTVGHHGQVDVSFTSLGLNGSCNQPLHASWRHRYNNGDGNFFSTPLSPELRHGFLPLKTLQTDSDDILVIYVCSNIKADGKCKSDSKRMRIMSRKNDVLPEEKEKLKKYFDIACIDDHLMNESTHKVDCTGMLA